MNNEIVSAIINGNKSFEFNDNHPEARILESDGSLAKVLYKEKVYTIELRRADLGTKNYSLIVNDQPIEVRLTTELDKLIEKLGLNIKKAENLSQLQAPMPGLVLEFLVKVGDTIEPGDPLLILEAMKMENVIKAGGSAVVKSLLAEKGDKVEKSQVLIEFE